MPNVYRCRLLAILCALSLLAGCGTTVQSRVTFTRPVQTAITLPGGLALQTSVRNAQGAELEAHHAKGFEQVLTDAARQYGLTLGPNGAYRLQSTVEVPPGKQLFKAAPQAGRNLGMAIVPVAGLFTPRYYTVSTAFTATFVLYRGDQSILTETIKVDEQKEVSVSNSNRVPESFEAALRLYEAQREAAIERFFSVLAKQGRLS